MNNAMWTVSLLIASLITIGGVVIAWAAIDDECHEVRWWFVGILLTALLWVPWIFYLLWLVPWGKLSFLVPPHQPAEAVGAELYNPNGVPARAEKSP